MVLLCQYACSKFSCSIAILKLTSTQFSKGVCKGTVETLRCPHCGEVVAGPPEQAFEASHSRKTEQPSDQVAIPSHLDLLEIGM